MASSFRWLKFGLAVFAVLAAMSSVAQANLILVGGTPSNSFTDITAQGFGNAPRLLTLQDNTFEFGSVTPINVVHDGAIANGGGNKSNTPTLGALGWTSGAQVGVGFNSDQSGQTGITLDTLVLTIFDATAAHTALGSFSLAAPITFTAADLALQQGNGAAVFNFGLTAAEQAQFNTIVAMAGSSSFFAGLSSSLGCNPAGGAPPGCLPSNDGPDSFLGFAQSAGTHVPEPTSLALLGSTLVGLAFVGWRRSKNVA